jgi:taurine dioxygenase
MISIEPITPDLGAEVRGLVDARATRDQVATILRRALLEHHLLVVRARILNPREQISLGMIFGELMMVPDPVIPEYPQILRITNQPGEKNNNVGLHWHVDGTREKFGTPISIWHVIQRPAEGGDTLFANMHRAYEELDEDFRRQIDGLKMVSDSGAVHALVKRHPATKRKMIYTSIRRTHNFLGMDRDQTKAVLNRLDEHLNRPGGHYRHKWQDGDVVIGDNFSVAHQATPTDPRFPRILHRVTIRGGTAFYRPAAQAAKGTNVPRSIDQNASSL